MLTVVNITFYVKRTTTTKANKKTNKQKNNNNKKKKKKKKKKHNCVCLYFKGNLYTVKGDYFIKIVYRPFEKGSTKRSENPFQVGPISEGDLCAEKQRGSYQNVVSLVENGETRSVYSAHKSSSSYCFRDHSAIEGSKPR